MSKLLGIRQGLYRGELQRSKELGYSGHFRLIWETCEGCGKQRWVRLRGDGKPEVTLCGSCSGFKRMTPELRARIGATRKGKFMGENHPNWKGGRKETGEGYIAIRISRDDFFYPMVSEYTSCGGYVREHRLVVAKALGRNLHTWEEVHHKGVKHPRGSKEDKQDNRYPENLELMIKGCHSAEHRKGYSNGFLKGLHDGRLKQIQELKDEILELRSK